MARYYRPSELSEALDLRAREPLSVLAGGTDVFPAHATRTAWTGNNVPDILDISAIGDLRVIQEQNDHWRIGALTTWTDLVQTRLPSAFDGMKRAAVEVGGRQIQNRATIAGNLCNASPAADGVPGLMALNSAVELTSRSSARIIPLHDFITGNRQTDIRDDEIMTAILVPKHAQDTRAHFLKLGARHYLVISIVMGAAVLVPDPSGRIAEARIVIGSCSAVARRIPALEDALAGRPMDSELDACVLPDQFGHLEPIDDIRASAAYRQDTAVSLTREILRQMASGAERRIA